MNNATLIRRSLVYYWRTNLAVILGVATAVAVLAGALIVGDSVRASLRDLVLLRLGRADYLVLSTGFFREALADDLQSQGQFKTSFERSSPIIILEGFVTGQLSGRRASRVQVYGIDERFWTFHQIDVVAPAATEALLSPALAEELGTEAGDSIVLRVEKPSAIPAESLHGRKEDLGQTFRLSVREVLAPQRLGEFSVRPQQGAIRAAFVPLRRLQTLLDQEARVNTLLISERLVPGATAGGAREALEALVRETAQLEDLGLTLRGLDERRGLVLESASGVIGNALAEDARAAAARLKMRTVPILTYLANEIRGAGRGIPYSVVTAMDLEAIAPRAMPRPATGDAPIVLNAWAARELGVRPADPVTLDYYVWEDQGRLLTRSARFRLAAIVPIEGAAADRDLVPAYPGITDSDRLSDWDPPFPIDLTRVRPIDEDYWHRYRTTPKAFIPLERGQELWATRFGSLTSIRILPESEGGVPAASDSYARALRQDVDPLMAGFSVYDARAQGLAASRGGTDFGAYFTYFSMFLVCSALLLAVLFFKLGVEQRVREIGLLQAVGFDRGRIRALFLGEGLALSIAGSLLGAAGAVGYGALMMLGLRTWWVGAVGTTLLTLHVSPASVALGALGGILTALGSIAVTLRSLAAGSTQGLLTGAWLDSGSFSREARQSSADSRSLRAAAVACGVGGLLLPIGSSFEWISRVVAFFGAGALLLAASLCCAALWLRSNRRPPLSGHGWWPVSRLGLRNATCRPGRSVLCMALVASATFIIVAVEAFRPDSGQTMLDRGSGTGGYPLLVESLLPIVHDLDSTEGRNALNLQTGSVGELEGVTFSRFRVRPGDDASCLNLYEPRSPRILATTQDFVQAGRFTFQSSMAATAEEHANPWLLLDRKFGDGAVPVIADANSMTYVLHLEVGEDLVLPGAGQPLRLRLVGALSDSIFQGELLMAEANFIRLFPAQEGYRFFLADLAPERMASVAALLESRLVDFGVDARGTDERLASFHRVEYTYLSTFQTLGGLGLLLGTVGLGAVLLRNVLERRRELALLRALGYEPGHFLVMVIAENVLFLAGGLAIGTASALLAIAPVFLDRGGRLPVASLSVLLAGVLATGLLASLGATAAALRSPLLPALRAE